MFYAHISLDFILPSLAELYNRQIIIQDQDESRKKMSVRTLRIRLATETGILVRPKTK